MTASRADYDSYFRQEDLVFFAITERSFPKELATIYLDDIAAEFLQTHRDTEYRSATLRPYAFNDFDTFIQRTKKSYENPRASGNLDKVQAQLKETTQIMSKNLEDLLYRGDSLERMGTMSSELRDASKKYKRAAVRINWQLLMKQVRGKRLVTGMAPNLYSVWAFCGTRFHYTLLLHLAFLVIYILLLSLDLPVPVCSLLYAPSLLIMLLWIVTYCSSLLANGGVVGMLHDVIAIDCHEGTQHGQGLRIGYACQHIPRRLYDRRWGLLTISAQRHHPLLGLPHPLHPLQLLRLRLLRCQPPLLPPLLPRLAAGGRCKR